LRSASSTAGTVAASAPPPTASTPTAANWDAPVNTSIDITQALAGLSPADTASTPNETPYTPTAIPIPAARLSVRLRALPVVAIPPTVVTDPRQILAFSCGCTRRARHDLSMDALDRAILRHLQADGRLTNVELAERVRLSPSQCLRRVRALERAGVIRGYHAEIDPTAVGRGFEVTVHVELTLKDRATVEAFEAGIAALDEVVECRRMFGLPDYVVRVAVADQAAYESFYMNELAELPGLARVNSQFTMKTVKRGGTLPV
jgi:Lrp/AsnC family transcriptional regulator, leucine-responsive regulatory protein